MHGDYLMDHMTHKEEVIKKGQQPVQSKLLMKRVFWDQATVTDLADSDMAFMFSSIVGDFMDGIHKPSIADMQALISQRILVTGAKEFTSKSNDQKAAMIKALMPDSLAKSFNVDVWIGVIENMMTKIQAGGATTPRHVQQLTFEIAKQWPLFGAHVYQVSQCKFDNLLIAAQAKLAVTPTQIILLDNSTLVPINDR